MSTAAEPTASVTDSPTINVHQNRPKTAIHLIVIRPSAAVGAPSTLEFVGGSLGARRRNCRRRGVAAASSRPATSPTRPPRRGCDGGDLVIISKPA